MIKEGWQVRELLSDIKVVNYERKNRIFGISPSREAKKYKQTISDNPNDNVKQTGFIMQNIAKNMDTLLSQEQQKMKELED